MSELPIINFDLRADIQSELDELEEPKTANCRVCGEHYEVQDGDHTYCSYSCATGN